MENQQSMFTHQFARMWKWQSEVGKEMADARQRQNDLVSHATVRNVEHQITKEELRRTRAQNRNRTSAGSVHGDSNHSCGSNANVIGGCIGSASAEVPLETPYCNDPIFTNPAPSAPTRDPINMAASAQKVFGGSSNKDVPHASNRTIIQPPGTRESI